MHQLLFHFLFLLTLSFQSFIFAGCGNDHCCQSIDVEIGWRRDTIDWKTKCLKSSYFRGRVNDEMHFKDVNSYTISGQAKWVSAKYYVRLSADYGTTYKGRFHEHFNIRSPILFYPVDVSTNNPVKRRSEVYDFDGAVGYPLSFFCCRLSVIPLIGFSFHRQHLRVKEDNEFCSSSYCHPYYHYYCPPFSCSNFFDHNSSSSFFVDSDNPFRGHPSSNPFSSPSSSDPRIASELGLKNPHETSNFRFTWYGFYLGADIAYALDGCWTLFWDTEFHFFDNCHRKRESWTGVYFVDDYHYKSYAYGFNNVVGFNCYLANCWYVTGSVDFDWWKADSKHDTIHWKKVGAKLGFAYSF